LIKKLSDKDKKDWEIFVQSKEKIYNKDLSEKKNLDKKILKKTIDLHGFSLENANKAISEYIRQCFSENIKRVTVITGKGLRSNTQNDPYASKDLSILKNSVPDFIKSNSNLMKFIKEIRIADKEEGGSGAFIIYLKNFKE
tara:strand:- start:463 stop:885 length:423 start_codon:yes stop_codon:yes gene_type:complete